VVFQQVLEQHALVELGAPDQEVFGRPLAALVLAPGLAQPVAVGLETACNYRDKVSNTEFILRTASADLLKAACSSSVNL